MAITADRLIEGVNRRISNPQAQGLLLNSDILAFADDIVQEEIIPILESTNQDFFVRETEIPIVGGQNLYQIPYRAVGRGLRELKIRDQPSGQFIRNMPLIAIEDAYTYYQWTTVCGFYFEGDRIKLVPDVPASLSTQQSLVFWYRLPPNKLVEAPEVAQVISIAGAVVTVDSIPVDMIAGVEIDFVQGRSGSSIYYIDVPIVSVHSSSPPYTITFANAAAIPTELVAGDYICFAGESYVLNMIPNEAYPLLETLTCRRCLQAISDYDGIKVLDVDADRARTNLNKILEPRIDGEPTIIVNYWSIARGYTQNQRSWLYGQ